MVYPADVGTHLANRAAVALARSLHTLFSVADRTAPRLWLAWFLRTRLAHPQRIPPRRATGQRFNPGTIIAEALGTVFARGL